jgi:hypothetical protein
MLDSLAATTTGVATDLALSEHARTKLLTNRADTMTTASIATIDLPIFATSSLTSFTDMLLLPLKLCARSVVEVAKGDLHT